VNEFQIGFRNECAAFKGNNHGKIKESPNSEFTWIEFIQKTEK
jgi:hypothetical protein